MPHDQADEELSAFVSHVLDIFRVHIALDTFARPQPISNLIKKADEPFILFELLLSVSLQKLSVVLEKYEAISKCKFALKMGKETS